MKVSAQWDIGNQLKIKSNMKNTIQITKAIGNVVIWVTLIICVTQCTMHEIDANKGKPDTIEMIFGDDK